MPDQIYIGPGKGLKTDRLPFNIDNYAFSTMFNFYTWRGRAKRKRGTKPLGQLTIQVQSVASMPTVWQYGPIVLTAGSVNLFTFLGLPIGGESIQVGSIQLTDTTQGTLYTEHSPADGTLIATGGTGTGGTINYATGIVTITGGGTDSLIGTFSYYPALPVMGLQDFSVTSSSASDQANLYPFLLSFDTEYSYQINGSQFYNTTYYVNENPFTWSGQDYQQFWTTNYSSVLWATNNKPGLHILAGTGTGTASKTITFNFTLNSVPYTGLVVGDVLWFNEWTAAGVTLNKITGVVTTKSGGGNYVVTFTTSQTVSGTGIAQVLTNSIPTTSNTAQDGIRYYTGDPTATTGLPTGTNLGWVNFAPPLTAQLPPGGVSINSTPSAVYYLVGALVILPFKDRILFFSPWIQASTGPATLFQLQDTVLWSWNGTPFYTTSDSSNTPTLNIVPNGETANPKAYYVDQTGLGGYLPAGIPQPIATVSNNEDVLLIGFGGDGRKTRFVYTGNDLQPFLFFNINSELPSQSTFSAVALDKGVIDIGQYGIAMTDQQSSQRIDLDIPDSVFQIQALNFGAQRVNAIRDFFREWIYFSYPVSNSPWKFPTQTFLFNYRDNTWSILYENYTTHGSFRPQSKKSWSTTGYKSWNAWREPWNSGSASPQFPNIIAGNPQGWVIIVSEGTGETPSGTISAISSNASYPGNTQITSYNHCVNWTSQNLGEGQGDYLLIQGCLGTTSINGLVGKVIGIIDANNFIIDLPFPAGVYLGLGTFTRLSQPLLQTKQFPFYWQEGRQVRLMVQKYLFDYTEGSQVTANIYLSQDPDDAWNDPTLNRPPNSLIYSQTVYTCPESTNLGLTPANTNLQMPTANTQYQIWHRLNTSLIGDSVQIGITLNDAQMRNIVYATDEIALHGIQLTVERGPLLA